VAVTREASVLVVDLGGINIAPTSYDELVKVHKPAFVSEGVIRPWNLLIIDKSDSFAAHFQLYESILQSPTRPRLILLLDGPLFDPLTSAPSVSLPEVFQDHRSQVRLISITDRAGCEWAIGEPLPSGIAHWSDDLEGATTIDVLCEPLGIEPVFNAVFEATEVGGYDAWSIGTKQVWFGRLPQKATADSLFETAQALVGDDGDATLLPRSAEWEVPQALNGGATEDDLLTLSDGSILDSYQSIRRQIASEKMKFGISGRAQVLKRVSSFPEHHLRIIKQVEEKSLMANTTVADLLSSIDARDGFNEDENRKFDRLGIVIKRSDDLRSIYRDVATQLNDRIVDGVRDWIRTGHSIAPLIITVDDTVEKVAPREPQEIVDDFSSVSMESTIQQLKSSQSQIPTGPLMKIGKAVAKALQPVWARFVFAVLFSWVVATGAFEAFDRGRTPGFLPVPESIRAVTADVFVIIAILLTLGVVALGGLLLYADARVRAWGKRVGFLELERVIDGQQSFLESVVLNEWVLNKTRRRTAASLKFLNETLRGLSGVIRSRLIDNHESLSKQSDPELSPNPAIRRDLNDVAAAGTFMQLDQVIAILRTDISTLIDEVLSLRIHEFKGIGATTVPAQICESVQQKIDLFVGHLMEEGPLNLDVSRSRESAILRKRLIETYWKNVTLVSSAVHDSALTSRDARLIQFINADDLLHLDQQPGATVVIRFAPEPSREEIQKLAVNSEMSVIFTETTSCAGVLRATGFRNSFVVPQIVAS